MSPARAELGRHFSDVCDQATTIAPIERRVCCGPYSLTLRFQSPSLEQAIVPSFRRGGGEARPDIDIAFLAKADFDLSHLIPNPPDEDDLLHATPDQYGTWSYGDFPVLQLFDRRAGKGVVWLPAGQAPSWELSRPGLPLIHALSIATPWTVAHSGAVGRGGRFLLLAGGDRSGKTTAALACARAGWDYAGDDCVIVHSKSGTVEPLYTSARLRGDLAEKFADILHTGVAVAEEDGGVRHELRLSRHLADHQLRGGSIAAILLPRRLGAEAPVFTRAKRADALFPLARFTTFLSPGWPDAIAAKMADLIACAPAFFVDTGNDPALIPQAFENFLDAL